MSDDQAVAESVSAELDKLATAQAKTDLVAAQQQRSGEEEMMRKLAERKLRGRKMTKKEKEEESEFTSIWKAKDRQEKAAVNQAEKMDLALKEKLRVGKAVTRKQKYDREREAANIAEAKFLVECTGKHKGKECEICEDALATYYCGMCDLILCQKNGCDHQIHKPERMHGHVRTEILSAGEDVLVAECESKGEKEDFSEGNANGKAIVYWTLQHKQGFAYLYKNTSLKFQFDAEIEFELTNMEIKHHEADSVIKLSLKPGDARFINVVRKDPKKACDMDVGHRYSLTDISGGQRTGLARDNSVDMDPFDLMKLCAADGTISDFRKADPRGRFIIRYMLELKDGFAFYWQNKTKDLIVEDELAFDFTNLKLDDAELEREDGRSFVASLAPGAREFLLLRQVDQGAPYSLQLHSSFSLFEAVDAEAMKAAATKADDAKTDE